ncbi:MAG TPA: MBL fold metallo-hydrolase [Phycisphaerales bacterium]|nr:MBL fold metallo-hydrolase [Phycisphaerales bacterium]
MKYSWRLLRCGSFRLDAGAMIGMIPKVVWQRWFPQSGPEAIDDRNRMGLQSNSLLIEGGGKIGVIEVGIGDKLAQKERDQYSQENRTISDALHEIGAREEDVSWVIVTHLHFDHAGGLTRRARPGSNAPKIGDVEITFPNAEIIVQRREWEDALANKSTMHRTYLRDHLNELVAERVRLIDGDKSEVEVLPGITCWTIQGHTWGQQAVRFTDTGGHTIAFIPDVMPTRFHERPTTNMAYDQEPYVSMIERTKLLDRARREKWRLVLDHEFGPPMFEVERDKEGADRLRVVEV